MLTEAQNLNYEKRIKSSGSLIINIHILKNKASNLVKQNFAQLKRQIDNKAIYMRI